MNVNKILIDFAKKHQLALIPNGTCGFGRPCVGFLKSGNYIEYNPYDSKSLNYKWPYDERLDAPENVNAYHKHRCMAVLVQAPNFDQGLAELANWVLHLESQGELYVKQWELEHSDPVSLVLHGTHGYALRFKE